MLNLRRCLHDFPSEDNLLSRLFHYDLKDTVREGLRIMESMPELGVNTSDLECRNSRALIDIRNDILAHIYRERERKIICTVFNFIILLYDSDEAWRVMIYEAIKLVKETDFEPEEEPRSEYWVEEIEEVAIG